MKKRILSLLLALLLCLTLCGCSPKLKEGEVYEKHFIPAHTDHLLIPYVRYNAASKSSTVILIPVSRHYPDQYKICIKAMQGDDWITETFYVPQDVYDSVEIGNYFHYDDGRDRTQPVYYDEKGARDE